MGGAPSYERMCADVSLHASNLDALSRSSSRASGVAERRMKKAIERTMVRSSSRYETCIQVESEKMILARKQAATYASFARLLHVLKGRLMVAIETKKFTDSMCDAVNGVSGVMRTLNNENLSESLAKVRERLQESQESIATLSEFARDDVASVDTTLEANAVVQKAREEIEAAAAAAAAELSETKNVGDSKKAIAVTCTTSRATPRGPESGDARRTPPPIAKETDTKNTGVGVIASLKDRLNKL